MQSNKMIENVKTEGSFETSEAYVSSMSEDC